MISEGRSEQVIKRSRFIARAAHADDKTAAEVFRSSVREAMHGARHNPAAFVLGSSSELIWSTDDGEPQGTAGAPILSAITSSDVTFVVVVVTRYFGGIKLGTAGLAEAYEKSAKLAIEAAGICRVEERSIFSCVANYKAYNKIESISSASGLFTVNATNYGEDVKFNVSFAPGLDEDVISALKTASNGQIRFNSQWKDLVNFTI